MAIRCARTRSPDDPDPYMRVLWGCAGVLCLTSVGSRVRTRCVSQSRRKANRTRTLVLYWGVGGKEMRSSMGMLWYRLSRTHFLCNPPKPCPGCVFPPPPLLPPSRFCSVAPHPYVPRMPCEEKASCKCVEVLLVSKKHVSHHFFE